MDGSIGTKRTNCSSNSEFLQPANSGDDGKYVEHYEHLQRASSVAGRKRPEADTC